MNHAHSNEPTPTQSAHLHGRPKNIPLTPLEPDINETDLFSKIKAHFDKKDKEGKMTIQRDSYNEFLKLLHLFGIGILSKDELLQLLRTLFGKSGTKSHPLVIQLEKVMEKRSPSNVVKKKPSNLPEVVEEASKVSPSYQLYPPEFVFDTFSGETEKDKRVINYKAYGRKMERGMEDYDGVKWRKNVHEGILNRVSLDLVALNIYYVTTSHSIKLHSLVSFRWKMKCTK
jgi:histone deacetylase complex regulatory component SIN3